MAENVVATYCSGSLFGNEFDALVSFVFNLGEGSFLSSTLLRVLNSGNRTQVAAEFLKWNKGMVTGVLVELPGLTKLREAESRLFQADPTWERYLTYGRKLRELNAAYMVVGLLVSETAVGSSSTIFGVSNSINSVRLRPFKLFRKRAPRTGASAR